ncbi:hypothetical protein IE53DRAFT_150545 [Violaceomyces palustris]|uniref:Uncharacterized protein n=1 Tax=Violaceomyces palustris TaxID=1673888 RepID=A0ACD0NU49_9BASI|nr:hypothetical protein IE53DRAFT_150545 [Violaceomyces palustris]
MEGIQGCSDSDWRMTTTAFRLRLAWCGLRSGLVGWLALALSARIHQLPPLSALLRVRQGEGAGEEEVELGLRKRGRRVASQWLVEVSGNQTIPGGMTIETSPLLLQSPRREIGKAKKVRESHPLFRFSKESVNPRGNAGKGRGREEKSNSKSEVKNL